MKPRIYSDRFREPGSPMLKGRGTYVTGVAANTV
jgi:hypothetical protein